MRVLDKSVALNEIVQTILHKAKYQKVIVCLDDNSDMWLVNQIIDRVNKEVVIIKYYYNKHDNQNLFDMINNGARVVVYNVGLQNFYKLQTDNNYVINIFLNQSNFILPYIDNVESVYGENLLVCETSSKDYASLMALYNLALNKVWSLLLQGVEVDTTIFKQIDNLSNCKNGFYEGLVNIARYLKNTDYKLCKQLKENEMPYYLYLQACAIMKMLKSLSAGDESYIDFYKNELSSNAIEKAHNLLIKYNVIHVLKLYIDNLIKINDAILNRFKIIIKKYFNFKNIKLNKISNIMKNNSKMLNIDNLLYISYIFNSI